MPFAKLPDAEIHYEVFGRGPPVLLVSGLGGVASYWQPNVAALAETHTVIVHDHRGTGASTKSEQEYSVELLADDVLKLMDVLGIARAALIGHSTGGAIGQILAANAPARIERLMLYASWATLCAQMRSCMLIRQELLHAGGTIAYHRSSPVFLYPPQYMCEAWTQIETEIAAAERGTPPASILDARLRAVVAFDGTPYLDRIVAPTTILVAQDDILTPPLASDVLQQGIGHARLKKLPYGAHAVSRSDPKQFNAAALEFLDSALS
jgi:aminoacrylate hydrolase